LVIHLCRVLAYISSFPQLANSRSSRSETIPAQAGKPSRGGSAQHSPWSTGGNFRRSWPAWPLLSCAFSVESTFWPPLSSVCSSFREPPPQPSGLMAGGSKSWAVPTKRNWRAKFEMDRRLTDSERVYYREGYEQAEMPLSRMLEPGRGLHAERFGSLFPVSFRDGKSPTMEASILEGQEPMSMHGRKKPRSLLKGAWVDEGLGRETLQISFQ